MKFKKHPGLYILCFFAFVLLPISTFAQKGSGQDEETFHFPPEWEPHAAVWVDFTEQKDWRTKDHDARLEIIETLHKYVPVKVLIDTDIAGAMLDSMMDEAGVARSRVTVIRHPVPNYFCRDAGPIFLTNGSELRLADFIWSCEGKPGCDSLWMARGEIGNDLAAQYDWKVISSSNRSEGGGIESSNHALMAFKDYALDRNGNKSISEIEMEFLRIYGKQHMVWVDKSPLLEKNGHKLENYVGQGANGHIDAFYRFLNDTTILATVISEEDREKHPIMAHDYKIFLENLAQLNTYKRPDGKPYHIETVEMPDLSLYEYTWEANYPGDYNGAYTFQPGDTVIFVPNMEYANILITNGAVLCSSYWREGLPESEKKKDFHVQKILMKYFPDRDIIPLKKSMQLNWHGGGIHCSTQQEPMVHK